MSARALTVAALAAMLVITGCAGTDNTGPSAAPEQSRSDNPGVPLPGDFTGSGPGTLTSAVKLPIVNRRVMRVAQVAARITYLSTSGIDGSIQKVTGSVFEPRGAVPEGGRQVVVFGHGSTGIDWDCAPSLSPSFNNGIESIMALLSQGFVVVLPDYQGLGSKTTFHPYLDATTAGYNMIDAARAAHRLLPNLSPQWVALGVSQGGQASWAANELNAAYSSPDLNLIGSVSISPPVDIAGFADLALAGTMTPPQSIALTQILASLKKIHPDLNLDDYRRGAAQANWDLLTGCLTDDQEKRMEVVTALSPDDLRPSSPAAADQLRTYLIELSGLPRNPASAPMLVVHGDQDQLLPVAWVESAVRRACEMGDAVLSLVVTGRGHDDLDGGAALDWMRKRFADDPVETSCDVPTGPVIFMEPPSLEDILGE